jgi:hypothetical protein
MIFKILTEAFLISPAVYIQPSLAKGIIDMSGFKNSFNFKKAHGVLVVSKFSTVSQLQILKTMQKV